MTDAPTDWADDVAAQIITYAYQYPNAREIVAEVMRMTYARGQQQGLVEANKIYQDAFATMGKTP